AMVTGRGLIMAVLKFVSFALVVVSAVFLCGAVTGSPILMALAAGAGTWLHQMLWQRSGLG
ncbi:hypothetical protein, partial [Gemmobacter sp.]|uniref:hypothetical protein n=1 Tax=Gemmobacter sp. TaxID=1898957 RepID=UPI0025C4A399